MTKTVEIQDILRLSVNQIAELRGLIDQRAHRDIDRERRQERRVPFRPSVRVGVLLENEPKGRRTYALAPRNISCTGISLLHGKFVYGGTNCVVGLVALDAQVVPTRGKVIWCRLITGRVHELGVQFDEPIDVSEFVDQPPE